MGDGEGAGGDGSGDGGEGGEGREKGGVLRKPQGRAKDATGYGRTFILGARDVEQRESFQSGSLLSELSD